MAGLKQDYARIVGLIEDQLEECKAAVQSPLSKEQYEKLTVGVKELSDLLFVQLKEVCTNLEKALPLDVDRLKGEHDEFYNRMIKELEKLKVDLKSKRPP